MNINEYEEIEVSIRDLKSGDLVYGTDGEWHEFTLQSIEYRLMYEVETSAGSVICSDSHEWNICEDDKVYTLNTEVLYTLFAGMPEMHIGKEDGPILINIRQLDYDDCRCLTVESEDHQFEVLTDEGNPVYTHNCQSRMVCGRVNSTASMMALGNSLGTAIDGNHKGAGIVCTNSVMSNIQYYFENPEWLDNWYINHGFDKMGWEPGKSATDGEDEILLGDDEDLSIPDNIVEFNFEDIHKEINNKKQQEFQEI